MTPKWSPGPWKVKRYRHWYDVVDGRHRDVLHGTLSGPTADQQLANAALASAAPDLYEIAEMWDLLMAETDYNRIMKSTGMRSGDFVKKVLAKAKGNDTR